MLRHGKILVCVLSGFVMSTGARAVAPNASGNPYQKIPERNVFNLKKVEPAIVQPQPVQLPKITLTGITTLLGGKRALLRTQAPARPGEASREESYILAEGQQDDGIEVLEIDEAAGTVKIKVAGVPLTLDFSNGAKPPTLPAPLQPVIAPYPKLSPSANPRPLDPDEQMLMIEVQRVKALAEGDPVARILPPTPLTSEVTGENPVPR